MSEAIFTEFLKDLLIDTLLDNSFTEEQIKTMSINELTENAAPYIFESDIPFFDEAYRIPLERKILRHYYLREIGSETPERFLLYLNNDMYERMPFYNKLYESELINFNPLYTVDKTVIHSGAKKDEKDIASDNSSISSQASKDHATRATEDKTNAASSQNQQNTQKDNSVSGSEARAENTGGFLDTPQGALTGLSDSMDIMSGSSTTATGGYLTNAQIGKSKSSSSTATHGDNSATLKNAQSSASSSQSSESGDSSSQSSGVTKNSGTQRDTGNSTDAYIDRITGYDGRNAITAIKELRDSFLNIDMMLIRDLNENFMMVY